MFLQFRNWLFNLPWLRGTTPGSQLRRLFSYVVAICIVLLACEAIYSGLFSETEVRIIYAVALVATSLAFFAIVCVGVVFLSSRHFAPDPIRLVLDTLLSMTFSILSFAYLYRTVGFDLNGTCSGIYGSKEA